MLVQEGQRDAAPLCVLPAAQLRTPSPEKTAAFWAVFPAKLFA